MEMVLVTAADAGLTTEILWGPVAYPLLIEITEPLNSVAWNGSVPTLTCVPAGRIFHPVGSVTREFALSALFACCRLAYATASSKEVCLMASHCSRVFWTASRGSSMATCFGAGPSSSSACAGRVETVRTDTTSATVICLKTDLQQHSSICPGGYARFTG